MYSYFTSGTQYHLFVQVILVALCHIIAALSRYVQSVTLLQASQMVRRHTTVHITFLTFYCALSCQLNHGIPRIAIPNHSTLCKPAAAVRLLFQPLNL